MVIEDLRRDIAELDARLIGLAGRRIDIARRLAAEKHGSGAPIEDPEQEARVLARARATAREEGVPEELAEDLVVRLIAAAVQEQEQARLAHAGDGGTRKAVVVGGGGRLGQWLVRFLAAQHHDVQVLDPAVPETEEEARRAVPDADLVLVAAPPAATGAFYLELADAIAHGAPVPRGVVADVASVKEPLLDGLHALQEAGVCVGSLHPLFGPDQRLLRGAHVLVCDTGDARAMETLDALFASTTAQVHHIGLREHDQDMADILARSHATALAFGASAPAVPPPYHSNTERVLARLAASVAKESPDVYFEIQALNPHAPAAVARLRTALQELERIATKGDRERFRRWMQRAGEHVPPTEGA